MEKILPRFILARAGHWLAIVLIVLTSSFPSIAQNAHDIGTPAESKPGQSTASAYAIDKIETINMANGNLSLQIPLVTIGGRGASFTLALSYNSKVWSVEHHTEKITMSGIGGAFSDEIVNHYSATFDDIAMSRPGSLALGSGWGISTGPGIKVQTVDLDPIQVGTCPPHNPENGPPCGYKYILTKMWLILPDGSEVEMRDNLTDGAPSLTPVDQYNYHLPIDRDRGRVWHSTDGSNITFISDQSVVNTLATGWIFLADGTRIRLGNGFTKIIDRNGNFVLIDSSQNAGYTTYTDELGRQVLLGYTSNGATIIVKGYGGIADRTLTIDTAAIAALDGSGIPSHLRADIRSRQRPFYSGDYYRGGSQGDIEHTDPYPHTDLFSGSENADAIDLHEAVTSLHLLDGRQFQFRYNQFGELAEIVYPGGGVSQIDYTAGGSGLCQGASSGLGLQLNRRVTQRRVLSNGSDVDAVWLYGRGFNSVDGVLYPSATIETRQGSSNGALLSSERHYFLIRDAEYRSCGLQPGGTGYEKWQNAKEFRLERQTGSGTVIEKRTWAQRADVVWNNDVGLSYNAYASQHGQQQPPNDPRVISQETILEDGKMSRTEFDYDNFNNVVAERKYDFGDTNGSLGPLVRKTLRTYGETISGNYGIVNNGLCYSNLNPTDSSCGTLVASDVTSIIHQRHLLKNETVQDAYDNQRAYSEVEYDNYSSEANHAAIVTNANMIHYDSTQFSTFQNQPRGNVTKATRWAGGSNYIYSFSQYDNAGNVIWSKDPKGNVSTVAYADNFGDGTNPESIGGAPNGATFALPTLLTNALGHTARTQYDYTRGVPTGARDLNNVIGKTEYDLLGRPTRAIAALGLAEQTISEMTYPTASSNVSTASRQVDATRWLASKTVMDGFGRVVTSWQSEDGQHANYASFTVRANTVYDTLGRVQQVSNPYRPANETAVYTVTAYDLAGRVIAVTTPDSAVVSSYYNGSQVLVKDQAGKERMSQTNALGQLSDVWEITAADDATESISFLGHGEVTAGYRTKYDYDTLGNLGTVTQRIGTNGAIQTRSFAYDPLNRLLWASNPESGTISYQYDNNGNLVVKTDARGVSSHYEYDALNRVTRRWYNGSSLITDVTHNLPAMPSGVGASDEVKCFYDSQALPSGAPSPFDRRHSMGRLVATTYGGGSAGTYLGYDALGKPLRSIQQIGGINYETTSIYNLAGAVTSMSYPSGRTVTNSYDSAGRLQSFTGYLGDGAQRTYANDFEYTAWNGLQQEKFGTTTPIYHKQRYNVRGQLWDMRASTVSFSSDPANGDRGAIVNYYSNNYTQGGSGTDNNGNLLRQENYIPGGNYFQQRFDYDPLNRLNWVEEKLNGTGNPSFKQAYLYDRWGNRTIDQVNTANAPKPNFGVNTSNNRLTAPPGYSMSFDAAGNVTFDNSDGIGGARTYDAENRMTGAQASSPASYAYDGDGRRVKRMIGTTETWQVYGIGGELLAEYDAANASPSNPQKEYGYRNGELLITAEARVQQATERTNVALASNGATATASSSYTGMSASGAINGDRKGLNYGANGTWASGGAGFPQWLQVDFNGSKTIDEIDVFTLQDNWQNPSEPTEAMTFSLYGLTGYDVQYWNGSAWTTVTGASVTGNSNVWRKFTFAAVTTSKIRVLTNASPSGWSELAEVEAWTTAGSPPPPRTNVALASNGATASASSTYTGTAASGTINGDRKGLNYGANGTWSGSSGTFPQWLQIDFNGSKTIDEIDVFTLQDNWQNPSEPSEAMTFSQWGLTGYDVQYWNGSSWTTVTGGGVSSNDKVWRKFTFAAVTTSKIRVLTNASPSNWSELTEVEAWTPASGGEGSSANIHWVVTDHLGTPRMVFDETGALANVSRHDYLPFGEEVPDDFRSRMPGYTPSDNVRQKFTLKERDNETGLDYFLARYYSSAQGRFTGVDPLISSAKTHRPESWNRYSYAYNNPLRYIDPDGQKVKPEDEKALDNIRNTLPESIRNKVKLDKNGLIDKQSLNKIKSKDANFLDLKKMVNSSQIVEVATASSTVVPEIGRTDFMYETVEAQRADTIQKLTPTMGEEIAKEVANQITIPSLFLGNTFAPSESSTGNLRIELSDQTGAAATAPNSQMAITTAHEMYGHGLRYMQGRSWQHDNGGPVDRHIGGVERRTQRNYPEPPNKKVVPPK